MCMRKLCRSVSGNVIPALFIAFELAFGTLFSQAQIQVGSLKIRPLFLMTVCWLYHTVQMNCVNESVYYIDLAAFSANVPSCSWDTSMRGHPYVCGSA